MPPASSQAKAPDGIPASRGFMAKTQSHPIPRYSTEETHFGQVIQKSFRITPARASVQTAASSA